MKTRRTKSCKRRGPRVTDGQQKTSLRKRHQAAGKTQHLDEVVFLGSVLVEKSPRCGRRHKEDGFEGDLTFSGEVNVRQGLVRILQSHKTSFGRAKKPHFAQLQGSTQDAV